MTPARKSTKQRWKVPLPKTVAGRRRLTAGAILVSAVAAGYLATCLAYPRPFLQRDNSVTRVIGLPIDEAEREL